MKKFDFIKKIMLLMAFCMYFEPNWAHGSVIEIDNTGDCGEGVLVALPRSYMNNDVNDFIYYFLKNGTSIAMAVFITYSLKYMAESSHLMHINSYH